MVCGVEPYMKNPPKQILDAGLLMQGEDIQEDPINGRSGLQENNISGAQASV